MNINITKLCFKCNMEKPLGDFCKNNRTKDKLHTWCRSCAQASVQKWRAENKQRMYQTNKAYFQAHREEYAARLRNYRKLHGGDLKEEMIEKFGGKCIICGYNKCHKAMDFHHRDPATKDIDISRLIKAHRYANDKIIEEIQKCVILCCRCHREFHANLITLPQ